MQETVMNWIDALVKATQTAVAKAIGFVPQLVFALLLLLFGLICGRWVGQAVEKVLGKMKISEATKALNLNKYLEPLGLESLQELLGKLTHFFIFLITLIAAADILGLPQVTALIQTVLLYIPKAVIALLILVAGLWASRISDSFLKGKTFQQIPALKGLVRFLIVTFAFLAALDQFEISPRLIEILFGGLIFAMAIAVGISFGLGGKDAARDVLERLRKKA